jgi:hypothetical protein
MIYFSITQSPASFAAEFPEAALYPPIVAETAIKAIKYTIYMRKIMSPLFHKILPGDTIIVNLY